MSRFSSQSKLLIATAVTATGLFCCAASGPAAQPTSQKPQASSPVITPAGRAAAETEDVTGESRQSGSSEALIEGFTEPYADIDLAAGEMGILAEVMVQDGDEVVAGQVLAKLNDDVLIASLEVARSAMSAEGELHSAETQFDLKTVEAGKLKELFGRDHASQKELDRVAGVELHSNEPRTQF